MNLGNASGDGCANAGDPLFIKFHLPTDPKRFGEGLDLDRSNFHGPLRAVRIKKILTEIDDIGVVNGCVARMVLAIRDNDHQNKKCHRNGG